MPLFDQHNRQDLRRMYLESWRKHRANAALEPLEAQIAQVIAEHPEYHALFDAGEMALQAEFQPEMGAENPFLHLSLHLALREQVNTDRPPGIARIHATLAAKLNSALDAEHRLIEALAETLWESQRFGRAPDIAAYLERAIRLAGE